MKMDKKIEFRGKRYQDTVPDTFDLQERAALALKAACNCIDKDHHNWMWFTVHYGKMPSMRHNFSDVDCAPKLLDAMTMLCHMTGDTENQDTYHEYLKGVFDYIEEDRLFWVGRLEKDRPWAVVYGFDPSDYSAIEAEEDVARIGMTSKMEQTCLSIYQVTGDPYWMNLAEEIQQAVDELTIRKDDYAYIPVNGGTTLPCGMLRSKKGWFEAKESESAVEGHEGSNLDSLGFQLKSSAMMYQASGSPLSKDLSERWAKYLMKPGFWGKAPTPADGMVSPGTEEPICISGSEQGHWHLHHHCTLRALRGILDYGIAMNDSVAIEFARRAYDYGWSMGIPKLGFITEHPCCPGPMEGCTIGDLIAYSIRLSDVGAGDYWDQTDALIRNMLTEAQYTKPDIMRRVSDNSTTELTGTQDYDRVRSGKEIIDETVGLFLSVLDPDGAEMTALHGPGQIMFCCVINCMQGLYYAWEAAVRESGDSAQVNLLFNRASKGLDVYSYLPYEGKVEIRNKGKKEICVRIPGWTDKKSVRLIVDGKIRSFTMAGQYLVLAGLIGEEFIEINFDIPCYEASYTVSARTPKEKKYTIRFRGSNAVDISPRNSSPTFYPFYADENMRTATTVGKKEVTRFIPDNDLTLW